MGNNKTPLQSSLCKRLNKDRALILGYLKSKIEKGTGLSFIKLKSKYNEEQLFYISLKYVTTTKKALCSAMEIPIEAGCRYKRKFEKRGLLVQSVNEIICPFTNHPAHLISTNSDEFEALRKSNQMKLF
ncbi:hypothetical protein [uncultured Tenacibaculum sp.]|uniref:hypothetical protein n=1 Tax=uncultured Tenacibaculum sp. TaxID=174713 RepID=UPI002612A205|nr:hypothetical protein [uncultured Tenacibaculum sp.]